MSGNCGCGDDDDEGDVSSTPGTLAVLVACLLHETHLSIFRGPADELRSQSQPQLSGRLFTLGCFLLLRDRIACMPNVIKLSALPTFILILLFSSCLVESASRTVWNPLEKSVIERVTVAAYKLQAHGPSFFKTVILGPLLPYMCSLLMSSMFVWFSWHVTQSDVFLWRLLESLGTSMQVLGACIKSSSLYVIKRRSWRRMPAWVPAPAPTLKPTLKPEPGPRRARRKSSKRRR